MVILEDVASQLHINHGSNHETIWNRLGFVSFCVRCVHQQLTEELKHKCFDICQHFVNSYQNKSDNFVGRIIMWHRTASH
jgi:calcineurin-like phosphoesterase family protein